MDIACDASAIIGANGDRHDKDFYPTPPEVTTALINTGLIPAKAKIWEPACGDGAMVRVFEAYGFECVGTDIQTGTDFLTAEIPDGIDWIVTNPPFALAEKFIRRAASFGIPFAFLLKCQYWHSAKRRVLFRDIRPSRIFPLTWRPDFTGQGSSLMDVEWVVWLNDKTAPALTIYEPLARPKEYQEQLSIEFQKGE